MQRYIKTNKWAHRSMMEMRQGLLIPLEGAEPDLTAVIHLDETGNFLMNLLSELRTEADLLAKLQEHFAGTSAADLQTHLRRHLADFESIGAITQI